MAVGCGLARQRPARMRVEPDRNSALAGEEGEGTAPAPDPLIRSDPPTLSCGCAGCAPAGCLAASLPRLGCSPRAAAQVVIRGPQIRS